MEQSDGVVRHRWSDCSSGSLRLVAEEKTLWGTFCLRCSDTGDSVCPSHMAHVVHDSEFCSRSVPASSAAALLSFMDLSTGNSPICLSTVPQLCDHLHRIRNFSWRAYAYSVDIGLQGACAAGSSDKAIFHRYRLGIRRLTGVFLC